MVTVTELHLHPVKACGRVEVDRAEVGELGLVGDREWQLCDADRQPVTQRTHPALATVRPEPVDGGLVLRAPGAADLEVARPGAEAPVRAVLDLVGQPIELLDAGDDAAAWFGRVIGAEVRLLAIGPTYERPAPPPLHDAWTRAALGDLAPVLITNQASLDDLASRASAPFGMERFRPNIVVAGAAAWDEDTWSVVRVGEAVATGCLPWPRCAVPQVDQDTGERHKEPARVLSAERRCASAPSVPEELHGLVIGSNVFGVAAGIGPVGTTVAVGDEVTVLERGPAVGFSATP